MMKKTFIFCLIDIMLFLLAACGGSADNTPPAEEHKELVIAADEVGGPAPLQSDPVPAPKPETKPAEIADAPKSSNTAMLAAYKAVLEEIYYDHQFPDGQDHGYMEPFSEDMNQFAIYDVDGDGQEELIVSYTSTSSAGMIEWILCFDEASGMVSIELSEFPMLTFYDNGVIEAGWSHSQGKAGDSLWPYTFWRYDADSDSYIAAEMVDAWDMSLVEDGFPHGADMDGDGIVYYIMQYGDYNTDQPVDGEAYRQWRDSYIGGASELTVPFVTLNAEALDISVGP